MADSVFVVMVCDRHSDPTPYVFTGRETALAFARGEAADYVEGTPYELEESDIPDWIYYVSWGAEGDALWVQEVEVDEHVGTHPVERSHAD